jgi:hypothetical protein
MTFPRDEGWSSCKQWHTKEIARGQQTLVNKPLNNENQWKSVTNSVLQKLFFYFSYRLQDSRRTPIWRFISTIQSSWPQSWQRKSTTYTFCTVKLNITKKKTELRDGPLRQTGKTCSRRPRHSHKVSFARNTWSPRMDSESKKFHNRSKISEREGLPRQPSLLQGPVSRHRLH